MKKSIFLDEEKLTAYILEKSDLEINIIQKVLDLETEYMIQMGIIETE